MSRSTRRTRELARRLGKFTEAQAALGWGMIIVLAALLGAIYLSQTSQMAATGRRIQELRSELNSVKQQNADIELAIAEAQELDRLQQQAEAMGFIPASAIEIEYLVIPGYPSDAGPRVQMQATSATQSAPPIETMQEAILLILQERLSEFAQGEYGE